MLINFPAVNTWQHLVFYLQFGKIIEHCLFSCDMMLITSGRGSAFWRLFTAPRLSLSMRRRSIVWAACTVPRRARSSVVLTWQQTHTGEILPVIHNFKEAQRGAVKELSQAASPWALAADRDFTLCALKCVKHGIGFELSICTSGISNGLSQYHKVRGKLMQRSLHRARLYWPKGESNNSQSSYIWSKPARCSFSSGIFQLF